MYCCTIYVKVLVLNCSYDNCGFKFKKGFSNFNICKHSSPFYSKNFLQIIEHADDNDVERVYGVFYSWPRVMLSATNWSQSNWNAKN